jgi:formate dehydrogenase subunit gamma
MATPEPWTAERGASIIAAYAGREACLMPLLHAILEAFGYIPRAAVPMIAQALNLSRAEVHGTISFYHDFRREPPGRHILRLCRAEACQSLGADHLAAEVQERLGIGWRETTPDGAVTLEPVFCLGLCAVGPSGMLDETPIGRLDADVVAAAVEEAG